uniref:C2H2-type domain-containing protein n=1 Tax=Serinus canaria TaxID=9135 RepID=A0A8C9U2A4_SERCA
MAKASYQSSALERSVIGNSWERFFGLNLDIVEIFMDTRLLLTSRDGIGQEKPLLQDSPTLVFPKSGSVIPKLWSDGGGGKAPEIPHEEGLQTQPRELQGGKSSLSQEGVRRCSWSSELVEKPHGREKAHKCLECGKGFSRSSTLMEHQNIHIGERSCECGECGKSFSGSSDLTKDHKIHTGKRWNSEILMEHQNIHIGKRSYECGECGKSFSGSSDLSKHHKIHTGERLHECLECQKSFRWNSEIVTHQHVHTRKRPCECPECGKSFSLFLFSFLGFPWSGSTIKHDNHPEEKSASSLLLLSL